MTVSAPLPQITGYPVLLTLLVKHIFGNALKFSKDAVRPEIRVDYQLVSAQNAENTLPYADYHKISFTDNGIGIDKQYQHDIFKIFFKIDESNRAPGVGLAFSKKIMALHDGFIEVDSSPGEGSTFSCFFPY